MNSYLKYAAAVAAVILVAVVGFAVLRPSSGSNVGGGTATPSPSPVASPSPSTSPSASAVFPPWFTQASDGAGILPAGSQTTRQFLSGSTFTVPDGWVNDLDNATASTRCSRTRPPTRPSSLAPRDLPRASSLPRVDDTPCSPSARRSGCSRARRRPRSSTPWWPTKHLSTSEPVDVTIGGLTGTTDRRPAQSRLDRQLLARVGTIHRPGTTRTTESHHPARHPRWRHHADRHRRAGLSRLRGFVADAMPIVECFQFDLTP